MLLAVQQSRRGGGNGTNPAGVLKHEALRLAAAESAVVDRPGFMPLLGLWISTQHHDGTACRGTASCGAVDRPRREGETERSVMVEALVAIREYNWIEWTGVLGRENDGLRKTCAMV